MYPWIYLFLRRWYSSYLEYQVWTILERAIRPLEYVSFNPLFLHSRNVMKITQCISTFGPLCMFHVICIWILCIEYTEWSKGRYTLCSCNNMHSKKKWRVNKFIFKATNRFLKDCSRLILMNERSSAAWKLTIVTLAITQYG